MILYKYRSLANVELDYVIDIILNQRLHCSVYKKLNDPFEGFFSTIISQGIDRQGRRRQLPWAVKVYKDVGDLILDRNSEVRICSLSSDPEDIRLWSYYADGHRGVVFEIDFSGLESKIYKVEYSDGLPSFKRYTEITRPSDYERQVEVLSRKTNHWWFESEHRIIVESKYLEEGKYFGIKDRIKTIYLGSRISDTHRKLFTKIVPNEIPIYTTKINERKITVERKERVEK